MIELQRIILAQADLLEAMEVQKIRRFQGMVIQMEIQRIRRHLQKVKVQQPRNLPQVRYMLAEEVVGLGGSHQVMEGLVGQEEAETAQESKAVLQPVQQEPEAEAEVVDMTLLQAQLAVLATSSSHGKEGE